MKSPAEPPPLWREVVGDTEPWRRGRLFLIAFALVSALTQAALLGVLTLFGSVEALLVTSFFALLFWFQFYLIWIGVHWVRWLNGMLNAGYGFYVFFWGIGWKSWILVLVGLFTFCAGAYLGLAPAVYFFALRQRETKRWAEAAAMGGVSLLLLLSLGAAVAALAHYKHELEDRAYDFANEAFNRIFTKHDTYFLLAHTTEETLRSEGRDRATRFLQDATVRAGDVREIKPARGELHFRFRFPRTLATEGVMTTEGLGQQGAVRIQMRINDFEGDWRVDALVWGYQ